MVRTRGLPGALALGLLASLVAHAAAFGDGHSQAGAYHNVFLGLAAFGLTALAAGVFACALRSGCCRDGSVLAARLAGFIPGKRLLVLSSVGWFALGESLERAHAPAPLLLLAALIAAAVLVIRALAIVLLRAIAAIAIAILRVPFAPRLPVRAHRLRRPAPRRRAAILRRPVTRPPPTTVIVPA